MPVLRLLLENYKIKYPKTLKHILKMSTIHFLHYLLNENHLVLID